jgi:beta-lactamase regulating signal transducer with metallopeptidase domain
VLEKFIPDLIRTSLIGSIGILILVILRKSLLKKYTQNCIYYMWLLIIARLLILCRIPMYVCPKIYNMFASSVLTNKKIDNKVSLYSIHVTSTIYSHHNVSFIKIIGFIWLIGVILASIYYTYTYFNLIRNIKQHSYTINDEQILNIYRELLFELKITKKIELKYYDGINSPFGTGVIKPYIVIRKNCYNATELKLILKHELIHFKKYDLLYKIGLILVKIVYWFNPLVYMMCKLVDSDCELACDESLLKNLGLEERKLYAFTFINSLRFNKNHTFQNDIITGFNDNKDILKRRLENMLNLKRKRTGIVIGALSALIISSSLVSVNVFAEKVRGKVSPNSSITITNAPANKVVKKPNSNSDVKKANENSVLLYNYTTYCNIKNTSKW